jgi:HD-GYP domain-containing protein (c-di-GMP phosphodiesterase class II)
VEANMEVLEQVTKVFSNIVDYRTHFTATHSKGVGLVAAALGKYSGLDHDTCQRLKLAGYLHDIGKIGVPTELIEKESKLTSYEKKLMNSHAYFTNIILSNIEGMEDICKWASMHHEKRDGSGYPFHKSEKEFSREVDILILSDIFTALSENRPYREGCKIDEILGILEKEKSFVDAHIYGVLIEHLVELDEVRYIAQKNNMTAYTSTMQSVSDYLNHEEMDVNC